MVNQHAAHFEPKSIGQHGESSLSLVQVFFQRVFDWEPTGTKGAKEALWYFAEQQLDVRLAWSPTMHGGAFADKQPESIKRADVDTLLRM